MENQDIILSSGRLIVKDILRKSSARMFKNLKVGDIIEISVPVKHAGTRRGKTYSTYIRTVNVTTGENTHNSFNQLPKILDAFVLDKECIQ
jgi:predicted DNA-binding ArsR family transcriptional regulator